MSKYLAGHLVADFLAHNGVETVFGIVSVHNIPMMDGITLNKRIRMVMTRGETGAAHMADGLARATGAMGVVISSTGPGASNTVPGLVEARFAGTPLLHITGQSATAHLGRDTGAVHDVPDQLAMLSAVSKQAYRVQSAEETLDVLKQAWTQAMSAPAGPVSVEIPIDIQRTPVARPADSQAYRVAAPRALAPSPAALDQLAQKVRAARRPLVWAGGGARAAGKELAALVELGFGMVTSWNGHGVVSDDHPANLGALNGPGSPAVQALYEQADLLLVVGSRLRGHETLDHKLALPRNLVRIDVDPAAQARGYASTLLVCGDAAVTLQGLLERLREQGPDIDAAFAQAVREAKPKAAEDFRQTLGPYKDFASQLRAVMPASAVFARDITLSNSTWGHRLFPLHEQSQNIYPVGAGIGQGLQLGIGAAIGSKDRKVVLLTGDGGFFFNMTEMWTAVQEAADIVMIVMNDGGYGVIKHMQDAMCEGRYAHSSLLAPDLLKLAELAGIPAWRVERAGDFGATVAQALATRGPTLVEVDMNAIGPFPPYYPYSAMISAARTQAGAR
ncbi:thiamine pyrophosphate-binding protein [Bordetella bronchiseptica]|uniref:thiamine pyrophosphate-binding protein n=1 Tax=Bordetella bronchiseptica TaxID=518 RepID=UPI00028BBA1C|nr:thiamine pyrophosphate-binding protein [Bordetella bronchiseptica]AUL15257.1 acetolactate synthase large subunit [Bordetella bronchiseptica]AWP58355.1 acetolactate synthase large subunit [Bordetella bronchiseptica]KAK75690.1 thiamine pyrophosphate enzyme, N-terminal TPP binding domain protein [Bordetella bronchiseptica MO211]KAK79775.1 thiamine pyrophosphate enzyme, N-terminal TPP binding domain protein [Bordetella bronchiseptica CA90 BB02]KCV56123.1 thiamine pyrophosphate enzyme, N-termina